jgi:hypothetical protein
MRKTLFSIAVVSIVAVATFNWNVNTQKDVTNLLTLANVEALAAMEVVDSDADCIYRYAEVCYTRSTETYHINWYA